MRQTAALFHLSEHIYKNTIVVYGDVFADSTLGTRVTVSSSLCTDPTFSSAAIFLPIGRAEASVGIKVSHA